MVWIFADSWAEGIRNVEILYRLSIQFPEWDWDITSSTASLKDKTSSGTFRSSSINLEPATTTIHLPKVGSLKIEYRCCQI